MRASGLLSRRVAIQRRAAHGVGQDVERVVGGAVELVVERPLVAHLLVDEPGGALRVAGAQLAHEAGAFGPGRPRRRVVDDGGVFVPGAVAHAQLVAARAQGGGPEEDVLDDPPVGVPVLAVAAASLVGAVEGEGERGRRSSRP